MRKYQIQHGKMLFALAVFLFITISCTTGKVLTSHYVRSGEVDGGPFTAILYSSQGYDYLETVALLDMEGDAYEIVPFGAQFNYNVVKGLSAKEADRTGREFIRTHLNNPYSNIELRKIKDPEGNILGYELRPLYIPIIYGQTDVLDVSYVLQPDGKVIVFVDLKEGIEHFDSEDSRM